ncbi:hypothetical protein BDP55DRAFT_732559 [Colletotrichum godetiae]|uniref:Uncharacterized protein n=1 Tax=Colletotrichum godetiae TaxID=1209918 RepID=A0AAJ0AC07_9PEZI|nr:uncharacterized protein BDP55DRAFT_732559 [Colletotrichum godetiae]KAK1671130.1 hypothetical protein BDP55DRAFT_732559 [Colletotrichum godetiae]
MPDTPIKRITKPSSANNDEVELSTEPREHGSTKGHEAPKPSSYPVSTGDHHQDADGGIPSPNTADPDLHQPTRSSAASTQCPQDGQPGLEKNTHPEIREDDDEMTMSDEEWRRTAFRRMVIHSIHESVRRRREFLERERDRERNVGPDTPRGQPHSPKEEEVSLLTTPLHPRRRST